jgi:hypothetical protein
MQIISSFHLYQYPVYLLKSFEVLFCNLGKRKTFIRGKKIWKKKEKRKEWIICIYLPGLYFSFYK